MIALCLVPVFEGQGDILIVRVIYTCGLVGSIWKPAWSSGVGGQIEKGSEIWVHRTLAHNTILGLKDKEWGPKICFLVKRRVCV